MLNRFKLFPWIVAVSFLNGCTVIPLPFSEAESRLILDADRVRATKDVPPLTGALSLDEAIARALKYNLDHRTRMLQQVLASDQLEAGKFDMLPRLMANAGYISRDNDATRRTFNPATGTVSEIGYVSADRTHTVGDVGLMWNVLDFGASYYTSKQNADQLLIANERRRKAMHTLIQNVRTAYWRALAAQKLSGKLKAAIAQGEAALEDARRVTSERVKSPVESLRYRRLLLENLRLMEGVERELSSALIELASLIGSLPGAKITLVDEDMIPPPLTMPIDAMEMKALMKNADLRESFYSVRIAAAETRKSLLKMLPGVSLDFGYRFDNDSYLINQQWREAGLRVGMNLFNVLSGPSRMRAAEQGENVEQARRMALQMSVLTQVHLARHQYIDSLRQYQRADAIYLVDSEMAQIVQSQEKSNMASRLDSISSNVTYILSAVRRYQAIAKVHETASRVEATLGLEPDIGSLDEIDLKTLSGSVGKSLRQWSAMQ